MKFNEKTLCEDLRDWAETDRREAQGEGHSRLLSEAADRIMQLEEALADLLRQVNNCDGKTKIDTECAGTALMQPPRP